MQGGPVGLYTKGYKAKNWWTHTDTDVWEDIKCEELKPTYYYKWEKLNIYNDLIETTNWVTDTYAEKYNFKTTGWRKIDNSKRTWEN